MSYRNLLPDVVAWIGQCRVVTMALARSIFAPRSASCLPRHRGSLPPRARPPRALLELLTLLEEQGRGEKRESGV